MAIWEIEGVNNDYAGFVHADRQDAIDGVFLTDGAVKKWTSLPQLLPYIEKNKKKQKPLADIGHVAPGSVILNQKAYAALKDYLAPFGQFLEVECLNAGGLLGDDSIHSQIHYFYNVTNVVHCIDANLPENCEKMAWEKPIFIADALPKGVHIFKDPLRVRVNIYLTDLAKERLEQLISDAQLTGAVFERVS